MLGEPLRQNEWGVRVALDFFLGGAGAGLIAFYLTNLTAFGEGYPLGGRISMLSLALVLGGLALLASELGRPSNLWRSVVKIRRSWMSRGSALNLVLLLVLITLSLSFYVRISPGLGLPLYVCTVAIALLVSLYPGMLLHSVKDIKSWRSVLQPALTFVEAASSGLALLVLAAAALGYWSSVAVAEALVLSTLCLVLSAAFLGALGRSAQRGARATFSELTSKSWRSLYPSIAIGGALPAACFAFATLSPPSSGAELAAILGAISILAGNLVYRMALLESARHEPMTVLAATGTVKVSP